MSKTRYNHYLTNEPSVTLGIPGDPFTLFYDYDQIRDRKLSVLYPEHKVVWLRARLTMTFLQPLRKLWSPSSLVFKELMSASPELGSCSFSIAAMAIMLNGIEALGSFLRPDISGRDKNKKRFQAFLSQYMSNWTASVPALGKTLDVAEILWTHFRNGIAHGFYIERPGSLEFLKERRFEYDGEVLRVCPQHFFHDLDRGVATYFASLEGEVDVLRRFRERFDVVHPN